MKHTKPIVAKFLSDQIDCTTKSQREIAESIGYENPNIITMFKQSLTKIPLNKAGALATALGIAPFFGCNTVAIRSQSDSLNIRISHIYQFVTSRLQLHEVSHCMLPSNHHVRVVRAFLQ